MKKSANKLRQTQTKHDFLHTFFPSSTGYQEIKVNGYYLVNQFNKDANRWEVAIHTEEAFEIKKLYLQQKPKGLFSHTD